MTTGCPRCEEMREEIRDLRAALGLSKELTAQREIGRKLKITPAQSRIVQALYEASPGRIVPRSTLEDYALRWPGQKSWPGSLSVHISRLRAKVGYEFVESFVGGYALSAVGRARVYVLLRDASDAST